MILSHSAYVHRVRMDWTPDKDHRALEVIRYDIILHHTASHSCQYMYKLVTPSNHRGTRDCPVSRDPQDFLVPRYEMTVSTRPRTNPPPTH